MTKSDVILVANSPGELSALVKPVAAELSRDKNKHVILVLTPCQYTSGRELEFVKGLKGIDRVVTAAEYKNWALLNKKPVQLELAGKGVVLYLGGDLAHAMVVAKKTKYPAYAYLGEHLGWKNFYRKFFVPDQGAYDKFKPKAKKGQLRLVGNLMVDSVTDLPKWQPARDVITFMPGSRQWEIDYMTPLYREIMPLIKRHYPGARFQLVSSPFVKAHPIPGAKLVNYEDIGNSELVITIPGTNTALLAARGLPMIVLFPLNNPEAIPLEGLADLLGKLPVMGRAFKKWLARTVDRRTKFFALPNQKAGREIVPEIRGLVEPLGVALSAVSLLKDHGRRAKMSRELVSSLGPAGAAKRIVEEICAGI
ncbi:MAG: hypothetical protein WC632_01380 [Candidatus Margulisiibacteriota bacterium]